MNKGLFILFLNKNKRSRSYECGFQDCSVWRALCRKHVSAEGIDFYLLAVSDVVTSKSKLRAFAYAWNPKDISKNNFVQTNGFTAHRQPIAQSTDGVRGKIGVKEGIHAFDITWEGPLGTVAVIGFATKHAALHCPGYIPLLGSDDQSWGWNLVDNSLLHNNKTLGVYPKINNPPKYLMGEKIRMIIDCDSHKAYFERGDDWMGIAFSELPPVCFYPSVCAVYGNTEVSMIYAGPAVLG
ncbi:hypothetical protein WR25_21568 [Diploscapter pachys]|uniref:B30.2/SPRY domain-containing protein n=1 Tax=Diploscapter pachys TaxID=2018661 RepID=A0A2A2KQ95_9BILA|nr:hypothetical protein WR25_21568 [Diploscapter pachys]